MSTNGLTKARARIEALADAGSFVEIGGLVTARSTDFSAPSDEAFGDGVVTGYATVAGKLVYVYSQDAGVSGGSLGEMHAAKIARIYDMAMKMGAPVIGLADSSGIRLEEAEDAIQGFGRLYLSSAKASGVVPQIMAVFGKCGGGMAVLAGMNDFVFMEEGAELFVNAPNTLDGNYAEKCDTASAKWQSENAGLIDAAGCEEDVFSGIRSLVELLPSNNEEAAVSESSDDLNRLTADLEGVTDVRAIASRISDGYLFFETKKDFAKDMLTGFIKLDGVTAGVIGNADEFLSPAGCEKAASFVNFCDAFDIPVITLTNVKGYAATVDAEKSMAKAASKLVYAFTNATVPKINVIIANAFASAYNVMNSAATGADIVYAVKDAKIGIMDASAAAKIIGGEDLKKVAEKFDEKQTALAAAKRGYVDELIEMPTLRKNILIALEMLFNKREDAPLKKHGTK